jgi:predicted amidophosphoribosyltransferase
LSPANLANPNLANLCPVCQARFRGTSTCSRCGADLGRLMLLAAQAWRLRETARMAIAAGDFGRGFELAAKAQEALGTRAGEALCRISEWLEAGGGRGQ